MNLFNLFGQNKQKNDPYWEFDKTEHFKPKLNKGEFYKLTGFDFGWYVLEPISSYIQDKKGELKKGKNLSYAQKALYYWWYVDAQVTNGGFTQFYYNDYGKYVPTIIKALKHIGDDKMVELINRSYELYLKENRKIKDARLGGWEEFSNLYKEIKDFDDLDNEYYRLNALTMKNIENYIRKNPNDFCLDEDGNDFDIHFSGELKTYYLDKNIKEIIPFDNGTISGTFKSYFENGKLKEEIIYLNGEQTGEKNEFYDNGNIKYSIKKDSTKNQFKHLWYYKNEKLKKLEHKQFKKDQRIGEYKEWYENGNLKEESTYNENDERVGAWLKFWKDGSKQLEAEFKESKVYFHNYWNKAGEQLLKDGTGIYINEFEMEMFSDITIYRYETEYKDYKRHGLSKSYTNNILGLTQEFSNDLENGLTLSYDENGKIKEEAVYKNGIKLSRKQF